MRERECIHEGCPTWPPLRVLDDRGHFKLLSLFSCEDHRQPVFRAFFGNGLRVHFEKFDEPNAAVLFAVGGLFVTHSRGSLECPACEGTNMTPPECCGVRTCTGLVHYEWSRDATGQATFMRRRCDRCAFDHSMARP